MAKTKKKLSRREMEVAERAAQKMLGEIKGPAAKLPPVTSLFEDEDMLNMAIESLQNAHSKKDMMDELEPLLKVQKETLTSISRGVGVEGFRYLDKAVQVIEIAGRKILSVEKLRALGVDEDIIGKAMEDGQGYYQVRLIKIPRSSKS